MKTLIIFLILISIPVSISSQEVNSGYWIADSAATSICWSRFYAINFGNTKLIFRNDSLLVETTDKMDQAAEDFLKVLSNIYYSKIDSLRGEIRKLKQEKNHDSKRMRRNM